jgi:hypothetical protein
MGLVLSEQARHCRYLAQMANYTYHLHSTLADMAGLSTRLQQLGLALDIHAGNPFYDVPSGHHGYLAVALDHVIIAIRGSGEADDWRNNLRFRQQAYWLGGHVHQGFALAASGITEAVQRELQRSPEIYGNKPLWLTGHSSGGSIAILVAQELAERQIEIDGIYTFGAPKVGDALYARLYTLRDKLHAFAALGDVVPLLPPNWFVRKGWSWGFQRYAHVVQPRLLVGKTISLRAALAMLTDTRASSLERVVGALIEFSPHSLTAYIANLK